jgi:hypothetical protein
METACWISAALTAPIPFDGQSASARLEPIEIDKTDIGFAPLTCGAWACRRLAPASLRRSRRRDSRSGPPTWPAPSQSEGPCPVPRARDLLAYS